MTAELPDVEVLELLPDGVVVVRPDGTVAYCTAMAARLLSTSPEQVKSQPAEEVLELVDDSGAQWWAAARPLEVDPRLAPRIPPHELHLLTAGRARPVTVSGSRVLNDDGRLGHLLLVLRRADVRQRRDATGSDLVATVSHEIRSPLTSVKGFVKTLLAKWDRFTDEQKRHMLLTVHEDADRVTRLLGELLDVSRIDAGRLQLRRQMVDVPTVALRVVERMCPPGGDRPVVTDFPDGVPSLYADPDKVEQIFTNLVENALNYGRGEVRLSARVDEPEVRFTVADQGDGIPESHLGPIFTKFFRRAGERRSGTGLGLYITKGLVEAHGGRVWAESQRGEGAAFHFTLPRGGLELAGVDLSGRW